MTTLYIAGLLIFGFVIVPPCGCSCVFFDDGGVVRRSGNHRENRVFQRNGRIFFQSHAGTRHARRLFGNGQQLIHARFAFFQRVERQIQRHHFRQRSGIALFRRVFGKQREMGMRYGYRVDGPYDPDRGMRFNPNKLGCFIVKPLAWVS